MRGQAKFLPQLLLPQITKHLPAPMIINNSTAFSANYTRYKPLPDREYLLVLVAGSFYRSKAGWHICHSQMAPPLVDEYCDSAGRSSIRFPGQIGVGKPGTDIIVNGAAHSPDGKPKSQLQAAVAVNGLTSNVMVFGNRVWNGKRISAPEPFSRMPLKWEQAFGGTYVDPENGHKYIHESNPLGKGWTPPNIKPSDNSPLPNVEWPNQLINQWSSSPLPAGFCALSPNHPLRVQYAGTYDEEWQKQRAPFLPRDFDPRFYHSANPALRSPKYLRGGESVRLVNLNPVGEIHFELPMAEPTGRVITDSVRQDYILAFNLETVVIETEQLVVRLFWKAILQIENIAKDLREVRIS